MVARLCRLPIEFRQSGGKSSVSIVLESSYREKPKLFTRGRVRRYLRSHPQLVEDWLTWSADKRTDSGWYFRKTGWRYEVGYLPDRNVFKFWSRYAGCAEFIVREIAEIAGLVPSH